MKINNKNLITALLMSSLAASPAALAKSDRERQPNEVVVPSTLTLTPSGGDAAIVEARLPHEQPGSSVKVRVGEEEVLLADTGEQGDSRAGDGVFSARMKFDAEAFVKANQLLAERVIGREIPLFKPGGRERIGTQFARKGDNALVVTQRFHDQKERVFELPVNTRFVELDTPLELPVLGPALGLPADVSADNEPVSIPHSLMITDLDVVNDNRNTLFCRSPGSRPVGNPEGEWTFWKLMRDMANGTASTSEFIKDYFKHWAQVQVVNGEAVAARPNVYEEVIKEWEIRSGGPGADLLPEHSPFRLLGIALRADLRGGGSFYGGGGAGEGRFVFSVHDGQCNNQRKTVILEYEVPLSGCRAIREWAQQWKGLKDSSDYNQELLDLTQVFTSAGASPGNPNGSAIAQVRTNERLPGSVQRELREFALKGRHGRLVQTTVKQEPANAHNGTVALANFMNSEWNLILNGQHEVFPSFNGSPFLGGTAPAETLWDVDTNLLTGPNSEVDDVKFEFALNTCSGCHTTETRADFTHLSDITPIGQEAILSGFLTGTTVPDARSGAPRHFDDLARRAKDLDELANQACIEPPRPILANDLLRELTAPVLPAAVH